MIFDNNLLFSNLQAVTVTAASAAVIDLQGGLAINKGVATVFGQDIGRGDGVAIPKVAAYVVTAFTAGGAATLQTQLQGAIDDGTGNPSTYTTYAETPAIAVAGLVAGYKFAALDWPQVPMGVSLPRYLRLNYIVATGPMLTGTIFAGLVLQRADNNVGAYPEAFAVGA